MATAKIQTSFIDALCFRVSVTTGVTSGASTTVSGITAESVILEILEATGAGAGAVTGFVNRTSAATSQGANYIQLNVDCDGDHLIVHWHDNKTS